MVGIKSAENLKKMHQKKKKLKTFPENIVFDANA